MKEFFTTIGVLHRLPAVIVFLASSALGQETENTLPPVTVEATRSVAERNQLSATTESVTAGTAAETVNAMDVEDTLKYLPSVLIRKRYIGDTQAPMATRTTGINAGARSLIFADGILLSTLINNNNANGSPQWFMVAPHEIERIDVMYGPYSAAYPGNSYGAVTEIATRMPTKFEGSAKLSVASQSFSQYGTDDRYPATQAGAILGNRSGDFSWWFSVNHLSSFSQPVNYLTVSQSTVPAGAALPVVSGAFADRNRTGGGIQVLGAGNLTHTVQDTAKVKLAYYFSPSLVAAYTLGYWQNNANAVSQSYLSAATGAPYFGGNGGSINIGGSAYSATTIGSIFSSNTVEQEHWMQNFTIKTRNRGPWNWEAAVSGFNYGRDITRSSTGIYPAAQALGPGRIADAHGTGWTTVDLKGRWHGQGSMSKHQASFGMHHDLYKLVNPTYDTANWRYGSGNSLFGDSRGKTQTEAVWAQDAWRLTPTVVLTIGGRYEWWRAYDGLNLSTAANGAVLLVKQPRVASSGFSPKFSAAWQATNAWSVTGSFGKALRFPTVGELYQNVQTGAIFTQANPFLKPEAVRAGELAVERNTPDGKLRVSVFEEHVSNALISQTSTIAGVPTPASFVQNVDKTRQRGVEIVMQRKNVLMRGLELSGNVTYVDARIISNSGYVPVIAGNTSIGRRVPYVPKWRAALVATYKPDDRWAYTLAGRYSGRLYATVDNTDINAATYQGFESFFVADARVRYRVNQRWSIATGVDNLNNRKYFLFHPFPQRTVFAELKIDY
jgi:iron complex outermembrane receptor protein